MKQQFKKIIALPLFVVYFLAVTGVTIQKSYCTPMDRTEKTCHSCCSNSSDQHKEPKKQPNSCCQPVTLLVKTIQNQFVQTNKNFVDHQGAQFVALTSNGFEHFYNTVNFALKQLSQINAPPDFRQRIPLYKLHKRFTFYG